MIALRGATLLAAALLMLAAFGAAAEQQPSALRLQATAVVAVLAPLFWPGNAATPGRTAGRVIAWSVAATAIAAIALRAFGHPLMPLPRILAPCAMLLLILLIAHAFAATVERGLRGGPDSAAEGREAAGRAAAAMLVLLGSLPLWFGPMAELASPSQPWLIDAVLGASPLTHLAVASGNDLMRNEWLYEHSNLAALQFSYPGPAALAWPYLTAAALLALPVLLRRRARRATHTPLHTHFTTEKLP